MKTPLALAFARAAAYGWIQGIVIGSLIVVADEIIHEIEMKRLNDKTKNG